ncbi:transposase [Streptomyces sp. NPDC014773]|uniref:transposase n=1 Tax=Streptomyces sp. NPDC014773 TaxID=3364908 RepID=UPI0036F86932
MKPGENAWAGAPQDGAWGRECTPFLRFDTELRRTVRTTNAIEPVNAPPRRAVETRGHFPDEQAALTPPPRGDGERSGKAVAWLPTEWPHSPTTSTDSPPRSTTPSAPPCGAPTGPATSSSTATPPKASPRTPSCGSLTTPGRRSRPHRPRPHTEGLDPLDLAARPEAALRLADGETGRSPVDLLEPLWTCLNPCGPARTASMSAVARARRRGAWCHRIGRGRGLGAWASSVAVLQGGVGFGEPVDRGVDRLGREGEGKP